MYSYILQYENKNTPEIFDVLPFVIIKHEAQRKKYGKYNKKLI